MNSNQPRVMIVDDERLVRDLVSAIVTRLGCTVVTTEEDGDAAVEAFAKERPDISFLDIQMGATSGLDVLRRIKLVDPGAVVVMLTGISDVTITQHCKTYGAQGYIVKGGPVGDLEDEIAQHINRFCR